MIARSGGGGEFPAATTGGGRIMYLRDLLLYSRARSIITFPPSLFSEHERHRISWCNDIGRSRTGKNMIIVEIKENALVPALSLSRFPFACLARFIGLGWGLDSWKRDRPEVYIIRQWHTVTKSSSSAKARKGRRGEKGAWSAEKQRHSWNNVCVKKREFIIILINISHINNILLFLFCIFFYFLHLFVSFFYVFGNICI